MWRYDFLTDRTEDGRQLQLLVVIDEFTRECLAVEAARSFTARDVKLTLQYLFAVRGSPQHIRSDNGPEFGQGDSTLAWPGVSAYPIHQEGQPMGERLRRIVQRQAA